MKSQLLSGLLFGAAMVLGALAVRYLAVRGVISGDDTELSMRAIGIISGLMVAWFANLSSKRLRPLGDAACGPEGEQSTRRFSALVILIGGLLYAIAWLAAPYELTLPVAMTALAGSLVIVLARCVFVRIAR